MQNGYSLLSGTESRVTLSKKLPFTSLKRGENGCFSGTVRTGKHQVAYNFQQFRFSISTFISHGASQENSISICEGVLQLFGLRVCYK